MSISADWARALPVTKIRRIPAEIVCGMLAAFSLAALLRFHGVVASANQLFPLELPGNPFFVKQHWLLLYAGVPLIAIVAMAIYLAPGLLVVRALDRPRNLPDWLLRGFTASFVLQASGLAVLRWHNATIEPKQFFALQAALLAATWGLWFIRARAKRAGAWEWSGHDTSGIAWMLAIVYAEMVLLLPWILWQDFNADGIEALNCAQGGYCPLFPDTGGPAILTRWFVLALGANEATPRLVLIFVTGLIFAALLACSEYRSGYLNAKGKLALALGLAGFVVMMGLNASYDFYFADMASPASQDGLMAFLVLAAAYFFWSKQTVWFAVLATVMCFTRPTWVMFLALLAAGVFVARGTSRARLKIVVPAVVAIAATMVIYELAPAIMGLPAVQRSANGLLGLLVRLRYWSFLEVDRVLWVAIPCGVVPLLTLGFWRRLDGISRALLLMAGVAFALFYARAFAAPHQFAPIMLLPLAVYGRTLASGKLPPILRGSLALAVMAAFVIAGLPQHLQVNRTTRKIANSTGCLIPECRQYSPASPHTALLEVLFPPPWEITDASKERSAPISVLTYYATRNANPRAEQFEHLLLPATQPPPGDFIQVARTTEAVLYVRRFHPLSLDAQDDRVTFHSPLYAVDPRSMHAFLGVPAGRYQLDVVKVLRKLRII